MAHPQDLYTHFNSTQLQNLWLQVITPSSLNAASIHPGWGKEGALTWTSSLFIVYSRKKWHPECVVDNWAIGARPHGRDS